MDTVYVLRAVLPSAPLVQKTRIVAQEAPKRYLLSLMRDIAQDLLLDGVSSSRDDFSSSLVSQLANDFSRCDLFCFVATYEGEQQLTRGIRPIRLTPQCVCRLKVTTQFYEEFKGAERKQAAGLVAAAATQSALTSPTLSADDIMRLLRSAVSAVLGASVADDQPLVEAGLDSLGDNPHLLLCRRRHAFPLPLPNARLL